jgi:sarcosine oxidase subunit beta
VETADVVVVGGGVMGCSLAYHLAARGVDVALFERDALGSGSTGRNAGGVRQQFSSELNVRIQMLSVKLLERFEADLGVPADFRQVGYLFLLTRPQDVEDFRAHVEMWHRLGLREATWLDPQAAHELAPQVEFGDVLGCTFCPTDGIASPDAVTMGYAAAARRLGAKLHEAEPVTAIDVRDGRVAGVRTPRREVATRVVVDCAGPWSKAVGVLAGVNVPVDPFRRHIWVTGPMPAIRRDAPFVVDFATTFYFHPEGDGILFGMSDKEEPATFSTEVSERFAERTFETALRRLPALEQAGIRTAWAGLYESTPDHQAILGPATGVDGFWCACGFSGHGFMQAPAAGLLLSQYLVDGKPEIDLSAFAHARFAAGGLVAEKNII